MRQMRLVPDPAFVVTAPSMPLRRSLTTVSIGLHGPVTTALRSGHHLLAGVDEAGAGPLAGPVVAAAVLLNPYHRLPSIPLLNDSKKLSSARRREVFAALRADPAITYRVSVVAPSEIDHLNILQARLQAMARATCALPVQPSLVFIDGHLTVPLSSPRILQRPIIGGDARVSLIAMASVVAKETRDAIMQHMHVLYPQYGFGKHMGYATREHLQRLKEHGPCPIHRRSYRPVREAEQELAGLVEGNERNPD